MWFPKPNKPVDWSAEQRRLARTDPAMKRIIVRVGPCTLAPKPVSEYFTTLCKSIYTQQISTHIAGILYARFAAMFPRRRPTPLRTLALLDGGAGAADEATIRRIGLSRQKRKYVLDLARQFHDGSIPTRSLKTMSDDDVIDALTRVHGIGRWTAEMFLIFVLNRPDVWPVDDLGLRDALKRAYRLPERPSPKESIRFGEHFRPHRTLATWYLWRSLG